MNEWMKRWMKGWMKGWMNEWMNDQECIKEWRMGDCLNNKFYWSIHYIGLMNEWKNEWMKK